MTLVSVTAVGAFDAVGSILVVALMIAPPAAAYLLTDRLPRHARAGLRDRRGRGARRLLARATRSTPRSPGACAACCGAAFALAWLLAPERGLVAAARRRARQRLEFAQTMLAIHLANHEGRPEAAVESRVAHLGEHLRWDGDFASRVVRGAERRGLVVRNAEALALTERGRALAEEAVTG